MVDKIVADIYEIGVDYHAVPLRVLAVLERKVDEAYEEIYPYTRELVVLATCNRFEVYILVREGFEEPAVVAAKKFLVNNGVPPEAVHVRKGLDAARHLLRVAAGLESMIIGEPEILGQVWNAYEYARSKAYAEKVLGILFHQAMKAGRRARTETGIARGNVGFPTAAVSLANSVTGSLRGKAVMVVGAGEAGTVMARLVASKYKPSRLIIANRSLEKARRLAEEVGGEPVSLDAIPRILNEVDVVLIAITVDKPLIKHSILERIERRLVIVDISTKPAVEEPIPPSIVYKGFEDVAAYAKRMVEFREYEARRVEAIIEEELVGFLKILRRRMADQYIEEVMKYVNHVLEEEVSEAETMLRKHGIDGAAMEIVRALAWSLTKKTTRPLILLMRDSMERGDSVIPERVAEYYSREYSKKLARARER